MPLRTSTFYAVGASATWCRPIFYSTRSAAFSAACFLSTTMASFWIAAALFSLIPSRTLASPSPFVREHHRRAIVSSSDISSSYDFVIAGGGVAGLVLASRLSEDSNHTVLVLEAGQSGDDALEHINAPGNTYWDSLVRTPYDWAYSTVAQTNANNRALNWPRGKVLGGSSAINGMYSIRPSKLEVDSWGSLVAVSGGTNTTWTWNDLLPAMKKSETWVSPDSSVSGIVNVQNAGESRGTSGPLRVSYPAYMPDINGKWLPSFASVGVQVSADPSSGETYGAFFASSTINPSNWTRSYSRSAYLDPSAARSNLQVVVSATVSKIVLDQSGPLAKATAVEFMTERGGKAQRVQVNKEVIVAGGAIGSPQILMLSGIGPKATVEAAGVSSTIDLPGVGQHLKDHLSATMDFGTSATTAYTEYHNNDTSAAGGEAQLLSYINSATAYVNLTTLMGNDASTWAEQVGSAMDTSASSLVPSTDQTVIAGYKAVYQAQQSGLTTGLGQIEVLFSITIGANSVAIQAALQRPFSQGQIYINSSNAYDYPVIDPRAFTHSADLDLLRSGFKFVRTLAATSPLSTVLTGETVPGSEVSSDDDINTWLQNNAATEYHPASTCAMLPLNLGGVVDTELVVYGTSNVRVIDASVFPVEFAAHLMAPTYGLAERGADLIRAHYNVAPSSSSSSSGGSSSTNPSPSSSPSNKSSSGIPRVEFGFMNMLTTVIVALSVAAL